MEKLKKKHHNRSQTKPTYLVFVPPTPSFDKTTWEPSRGTKTKNHQRNAKRTAVNAEKRRLFRETGEDGFEAIQLWRRWQGIT